MRRILFFLVFSSFFVLPVCGQFVEQRLFHISKSQNRNIVCYDARVFNGDIDPTEPVHAYWQNNEDKPGTEEELTILQKRLAYGYKVLSGNTQECVIQMKASKNRNLRLCKENGRWVAMIEIDGKQCVLTSMYIKSKDKNPLVVEYVLLKGRHNGSEVEEKVLPR